MRDFHAIAAFRFNADDAKAPPQSPSHYFDCTKDANCCVPLAVLFGRLFCRRCFTIQPILLFGQREPCCFHALVSLMRCLIRRAFRKLRAVFRILPEVVRLFHCVLLGETHRQHQVVYNEQLGDNFSTLNVCSALGASAAHARELREFRRAADKAELSLSPRVLFSSLEDM